MHIETIARIIVGVIFGASATAKVLNFRWFTGVVESYNLVPVSTVGGVACFVTVFEAFVALGLLTGFYSKYAAYAAVFLLCAFASIIVLALGRGQSGIECGCLFKRARIGRHALLRNFGLAGLAWLSAGELAWPLDGVLAALFLACAGLSLLLARGTLHKASSRREGTSRSVAR